MHGAGAAARRGMRSMRRRTATSSSTGSRRARCRGSSTFARPYRAILIVFLVAVVLDAIVSSVAPLVLRAIIDTGIHAASATRPHHRAGRC